MVLLYRLLIILAIGSASLSLFTLIKAPWNDHLEEVNKHLTDFSYLIASMKNTQDEIFGGDNFKFVAGRTYRLAGSGVGTTDTTIKLQSFKIPVTGQKLVMTDFGDIGYLTLEPGNGDKKEFVSFTGITQNSDDTADLTGVTRGLSFIYPYAASTTLRKAHSGGSNAVVSNPPQLYDKLTAKDNDESVVGIWTFTTPPIGVNSATASNQFVTKNYVDNTVSAGAATSTETRGGLVELGTRTEQASSTDLGANQPTVLQTKNATSTPMTFSGIGNTYVVVSEDDGKLNQNWFDLTEAFTFSTTSHYFLNVGTLTATNTARMPSSLSIGGVSYTWPTSNTLGVLQNNGAGTLTWAATTTPLLTWMVQPLIMATSTSNLQMDTNTRVETILFNIPDRIAINKIGFTTRTIAAAGTLNIAIFSEDGTTRLLNHTTSLIGGATGATSTTLGATLTLNPGNYYAAIQSVGSTDITMVVWNCSLAGELLNLITSEPRICGRVTGAASTMPTTITPTSIDETQGGGARLRFDN